MPFCGHLHLRGGHCTGNMSHMRITAEIAREFALRSAAARRLKREREEQARLNPPAPTASNIGDAEDTYRQARLARVRVQLARIDNMLERETDPQKLDRLAGASSKLSEQERQLSNRPMPPTVRTAAVRPKDGSASCYSVVGDPE